MDIMIVDDESSAREEIKEILEDIYPDAALHVFEGPDEAVASAKEVSYSIACLDINMEPYNGIEAARALITEHPRLNIIFITSTDKYSMEAMSLHASGYILKPVTKEKLANELAFLRYEIDVKEEVHLRALCLGNFDFMIDGVSAVFAYSKTKELLAYLIDRKGTVCTNNEISSVLGDDEEDGVLGYSYLNGIRRDLVKVFEDAGYPDVIIRQRGGMKIDTSRISCDYYDLLEGRQEAVNSYNGEYMNQYSWAEPTNGELWRKYIN